MESFSQVRSIFTLQYYSYIHICKKPILLSCDIPKAPLAILLKKIINYINITFHENSIYIYAINNRI